MSEHVVLKNVKRDLKLATSSPIKAGMDNVSVDANHLKWLIEQAEQTESFKKLHKNYLDRYVKSVGEINELKDKVFELNLELEATKPLYSRRKLEVENKRLREALEFYANTKNWSVEIIKDNGNKHRVAHVVNGDSGERARTALEGTK